MSFHPWSNKTESERNPKWGDLSLTRLRDEVDALFDRFLHEPWGPKILESLPARLGMAPRIDMTEDDDQVILEAELPGVSPDDVQISVTAHTLTISGNKNASPDDKRRIRHYAERQFGEFHRHIELPSSIDSNRVNAVFNNGVLVITLAKRLEDKPKPIPIQSESEPSSGQQNIPTTGS